MRKICCVLFFILFTRPASAQTNLIYNGDFELYDTCPVFFSTPFDFQFNTCSGWYIPTAATSDYMNACAGFPVSIPMNVGGYQYPYSGNAYCGLAIVRSVIPAFVENSWWSEYIQSKLTVPLKAGFEYEFSGHVALGNYYEYAYSEFGAWFSEVPAFRSNSVPFDVAPQVQNPAHHYLADTLNWMEVKGRFIANGNEQYITMGFFIDTLSPDTSRVAAGTAGSDYCRSYYYVDDCKLTEIGNTESSTIFSPNGDGINDLWKPNVGDHIIRVEIYNRWGVLIKELTADDLAWDGNTASGKSCSDGVYFYIIEREEEEALRGFIQLVR